MKEQQKNLGTDIKNVLGVGDKMRRTTMVRALSSAVVRVKALGESENQAYVPKTSYVTDQNLLAGVAIVGQFIFDTRSAKPSEDIQDSTGIDRQFESLPFELIGEMGTLVHSMNIQQNEIIRDEVYQTNAKRWRKEVFMCVAETNDPKRNERIQRWNDTMGPVFLISPGTIEYARTQIHEGTISTMQLPQLETKLWNGLQKVIEVITKKRELPEEEPVPPFVAEPVVEKKKRRPAIASFGVVVTSVHKYATPDMDYIAIHRLITNIDRALTNDGMIRIAGISEQDKNDFLQDRIQRIKENTLIKKEKERNQKIEEITNRVNDVWLRLAAYKQLGTSTR